MTRRPHPLQVTLAGLLTAVAAIALCLTALTHASPSWASAFLTGTVAVLFLAVSRAVATRGRSRAFWIGFAVWGWGYLLLVSWSPNSDPWRPARGARSVHEALLTTKLLGWGEQGMVSCGTSSITHQQSNSGSKHSFSPIERLRSDVQEYSKKKKEGESDA